MILTVVSPLVGTATPATKAILMRSLTMKIKSWHAYGLGSIIGAIILAPINGVETALIGAVISFVLFVCILR